MVVIGLEIVNGPINTTVRSGDIANIFCGFVNESVNFVPDWRITRRNKDGNVISNMSISRTDIIRNTSDGLWWVPDTTSGEDMSPNSKLEVGPVDEAYNQSSYQCIFALDNSIFESSIGTLTVAGEYAAIYVCTFTYISRKSVKCSICSL